MGFSSWSAPTTATPASRASCSYLWSNGLKVVYKDGEEWKTDIGTPGILKAFTFWTDMNNVHKVVPEGITEVTYPIAANYFAMGYTGVMVSGGNAMGVTYAAAPDLKGKIGTFPMPGIEPGSMMNTGAMRCRPTPPRRRRPPLSSASSTRATTPRCASWQESGKLPATAAGLASEYLQGQD